MPEVPRSIESDAEPELSELIAELDAADLAILKRYAWFINIPSNRNHEKVAAETACLYDSFGQFLRKILNGEIVEDPERVTLTTTVMIDIAQKHHWTLSEYATDKVIISTPNWEEMYEETRTELTRALDTSPAQFSSLAIDKMQNLFNCDTTVMSLLIAGIQQRRRETGRHVLGAAKHFLTISAGTAVGLSAWQRFGRRY